MDKFIPKDKHIFTEKIIGKSDRGSIYGLTVASSKSIFVFGGYDEVSLKESAYGSRYDILENKWYKMLNAPIDLRRGVAEIIDDDIFIIGAGTEGKNIFFSLSYDISDDLWEEKARILTVREGLVSGVIYGYIYVASGYRKSIFGAVSGFLKVYDIEEDIWKVLQGPIKYRSFVTSVVIDNYLYVLSMDGAQDEKEKCTNLDRYFPETNLWEAMPNMPRPRYESVAVAIDSKIFILCGRSDDNYITIDYYDTRTRKWTISDIPTPQINSPGVAMIGNKIYLVGGKTRAGEYNRNLYEITYEGMKA